MSGSIAKAVQALVAWAIVGALLWVVWPPALRMSPLWLLSAISVLANVFQPTHSLLEGSRTPHDRGTAAQIVWTVYLTQIAAIVELVLRRRPSLPLDALGAAAFAVMVAGLALRTWSVLVLGRFFTWNVEVQPGQTLVRDGPYRMIRHPSYTGALVTFVASCVLLRSWVAAGLAAVALPLAFARRIRYEEQLLRATFPEYGAYAARTGALYPRIR
jgi:protein-S-isoprenylcysteine O-methyltransferase